MHFFRRLMVLEDIDIDMIREEVIRFKTAGNNLATLTLSEFLMRIISGKDISTHDLQRGIEALKLMGYGKEEEKDSRIHLTLNQEDSLDYIKNLLKELDMKTDSLPDHLLLGISIELTSSKPISFEKIEQKLDMLRIIEYLQEYHREVHEREEHQLEARRRFDQAVEEVRKQNEAKKQAERKVHKRIAKFFKGK